jgi:hypothetical protein
MGAHHAEECDEGASPKSFGRRARVLGLGHG